jgi:hypothetical protein
VPGTELPPPPRSHRFIEIFVCLFIACTLAGIGYFYRAELLLLLKPDVDHARAFEKTPPQNPSETPVPVPIPTEENLISAQEGFDYAVAYTGTGFTPDTVNIQRGEPVRIINNSGDKIMLQYGNTTQVLEPGAYWERSFPEGTARVQAGNMRFVLSIYAQ